MTDMGTNTSNVVIKPTGSGPRPLHMEANAQTSLPIVDVILPSSLGDHVVIPHVNLSISGYEPDSLRTSGIRSSPVRAQEVIIILQLDRPGSHPIRDHTRDRVGRFSHQVEPDPSQGGTCVQRASTGGRREYPQGDSDSDGYRRLHRNQRPPDRGEHLNRGGRPPDRGGHPDRGGYPNRGGIPPNREGYPAGGPPDRDGGPHRGGYPNGGGRPPGRGGYPGGGPPYEGGEHPDGGGPPGPPGGQGLPGPQGPLGSVRPIIGQTPR